MVRLRWPNFIVKFCIYLNYLLCLFLFFLYILNFNNMCYMFKKVETYMYTVIDRKSNEFRRSAHNFFFRPKHLQSLQKQKQDSICLNWKKLDSLFRKTCYSTLLWWKNFLHYKNLFYASFILFNLLCNLRNNFKRF